MRLIAYNRRDLSEHAQSSALSGKKPSLMAMIMALLYILLWISTFIATKIGITYFPPVALLCIRFIVATLILVIYCVMAIAFTSGETSMGEISNI